MCKRGTSHHRISQSWSKLSIVFKACCFPKMSICVTGGQLYSPNALWNLSQWQGNTVLSSFPLKFLEYLVPAVQLIMQKGMKADRLVWKKWHFKWALTGSLHLSVTCHFNASNRLQINPLVQQRLQHFSYVLKLNCYLIVHVLVIIPLLGIYRVLYFSLWAQIWLFSRYFSGFWSNC